MTSLGGETMEPETRSQRNIDNIASWFLCGLFSDLRPYRDLTGLWESLVRPALFDKLLVTPSYDGLLFGPPVWLSSMRQLYQTVLSGGNYRDVPWYKKVGTAEVTCTHVFCGTVARATAGDLTSRTHRYIAPKRYLQYAMTSIYPCLWVINMRLVVDKWE